MSKSYAVKAADIQLDGKTPPHTHQSGLIAHNTSAVQGLYAVAPCDLYIERAGYNVPVLASHASAELNFGSYADPDAYIDAVDLTNVVAGTYEIDMADATVISRTIPKGTCYNFNTGAASAVGSVSAWAVLRPL